MKGDWVTSVTEDMKELEMNLLIEQIEVMSKGAFKEIIRSRVQSKAFEFLTKRKELHSKARNIQHEMDD